MPGDVYQIFWVWLDNCTRQNTKLIMSWIRCPLQIVFLCMMILANFDTPTRTPKWPVPVDNFSRAFSCKCLRIYRGQLRTCSNHCAFVPCMVVNSPKPKQQLLKFKPICNNIIHTHDIVSLENCNIPLHHWKWYDEINTFQKPK